MAEPERPEGTIVTDDYSWETGIRSYRVFSLTESELNALRWSPWWIRRGIINRVFRETTFEDEPDETDAA